MNMLFNYPACFYPAEEGGYTVDFPDLPGCVTEGDTLTEALYMAKEAGEGWIYCTLKHGEKLPVPTPQNKVTANEYPNGFVNLVILDIDEYIRKYYKNPPKPPKKTFIQQRKYNYPTHRKYKYNA
jgi:predicted RNase H-like HicB family nuclease